MFKKKNNEEINKLEEKQDKKQKQEKKDKKDKKEKKQKIKIAKPKLTTAEITKKVIAIILLLSLSAYTIIGMIEIIRVLINK